MAQTEERNEDDRDWDKFATTIGDLIVALSDAAFEVCKEKRDDYFLVAFALKHLLDKAHRKKIPIAARLVAGRRKRKEEHPCFESTKCTRTSLPSS